GSGRSAGRALRPSSAGGRLYAPDGNQLAAVCRSVHTHKNLNYDPIKDFVPITRVGSFTLMLVVNAKLPIRSVKELVEYAKVHPGELSFASGNTAGIVGGHTLAKWGEMSMLHIPYKTTGPALEDIIAGRVSMMFADFTTAMPHVEAGTVR